MRRHSVHVTAQCACDGIVCTGQRSAQATTLFWAGNRAVDRREHRVQTTAPWAGDSTVGESAVCGRKHRGQATSLRTRDECPAHGRASSSRISVPRSLPICFVSCWCAGEGEGQRWQLRTNVSADEERRKRRLREILALS